MWDIIFFDLDGTLTDPALGITNSVMHALKKFDIPVPPREELYKFIGPPLLDSFSEYYGLSHDDSVRAIAYYREYFTVDGMFENSVYDGIPEMLEKLKNLGKKLIVATSKPEEFSIKIAEHFDLLKYFDFVAGSTLDETRTGKSEVIEYALHRLGDPDKFKIIMVGDREHDVKGAHENGLPCVGVLYGYGNREEFLECNADYIASDVDELFAILAE